MDHETRPVSSKPDQIERETKNNVERVRYGAPNNRSIHEDSTGSSRFARWANGRRSDARASLFLERNPSEEGSMPPRSDSVSCGRTKTPWPVSDNASNFRSKRSVAGKSSRKRFFPSTSRRKPVQGRKGNENGRSPHEAPWNSPLVARKRLKFRDTPYGGWLPDRPASPESIGLSKALYIRARISPPSYVYRLSPTLRFTLPPFESHNFTMCLYNHLDDCVFTCVSLVSRIQDSYFVPCLSVILPRSPFLATYTHRNTSTLPFSLPYHFSHS